MRDRNFCYSTTNKLSMDSKSEAKAMKIDENAKQDVFSLLPDELIHHILSFLDMTIVVQSSVLSKRWRYLWTCVPNLNFDVDHYAKVHPSSTGLIGFISFVDMVLFLRRSDNIKTFRILDNHVRQNCINEGIWSIGSHIDTWTHVVVLNNVEELDLQVYCKQSLKLPRCLFTCKSLTTLRLVMMNSCVFLNLPDTIVLPSLKHIHLGSITFQSDKLSNFISRCPVLERLSMQDCYIAGLSNKLTIRSHQLKELDLKLAENTSICSDYIGYSNVTVYAPRLLAFTCRDSSKMHDYDLANISSLERVEMKLGTISNKGENKWTSENVERVIKCLQGVSAVKRSLTLSLSAKLLKSFFDGPAGSGDVVITSFCNLSILKLKAEKSRFSVHCVMYLLDKCPNLETFILNTENHPLISQANFDLKKHSISWIAELQLECMQYLKSFEFKGLVGYANELNLLKFLLKKATVLEKMTIFTSETQTLACQGRIQKFRAHLPRFPSVSSSIVQVVFSAEGEE